MSKRLSDEGKALLLRLHPRSRATPSAVFDVLATLEHDMQAALNGKAVLLADWERFLKQSTETRYGFIRALFLIAALSGMTSADIHALRAELANVTPERRRPPRLFTGPRERQTRGLF